MLDQLKRVLVERYIGAITIGLLVANAIKAGIVPFAWLLGLTVTDIFIVNPFYRPRSWMESLRLNFRMDGYAMFTIVLPLAHALEIVAAAAILYIWLYRVPTNTQKGNS